MGLMTTVALGLAGAGMQFMQGVSANKDAKYNAGLMEQQASLIEQQKKLEDYQYGRQIAKVRGQGVARTAKSGLEMSGSPLAVMLDTETQMEFDRSIGQYNYEIQKRNAYSSADAYRRKGKQAMFGGMANSFSSILNTGFNAGSRAGFFTDNASRAGRI